MSRCDECAGSFDGRANRLYCSIPCKKRGYKNRVRARQSLPSLQRRLPPLNVPGAASVALKRRRPGPAPGSVLASLSMKERTAFRRWMDAKNRDAREFEHQLHRNVF